MPKSAVLPNHDALRPAVPADALVLYPLLALFAGLIAVYAFDLDHGWADLLFHLEGDQWSLRDAWLTSQVLHEYGQQFSIAWGVLLLAVTAVSFAWERLRRWRRGLACLCLCLCLCLSIIISLLLVSLSKHMLALPCPWDLARYGADVAGAAVYALHPDKVGGCFPAGHATGGYCLVAFYFFARVHGLRRPALWLLPGLVVGLIYGLTQELRGAHFLSHDIVSLALCWFVSYAVFRIGFRRLRPSAGDILAHKPTAAMINNIR